MNLAQLLGVINAVSPLNLHLSDLRKHLLAGDVEDFLQGLAPKYRGRLIRSMDRVSKALITYVGPDAPAVEELAGLLEVCEILQATEA